MFSVSDLMEAAALILAPMFEVMAGVILAALIVINITLVILNVFSSRE